MGQQELSIQRVSERAGGTQHLFRYGIGRLVFLRFMFIKKVIHFVLDQPDRVRIVAYEFLDRLAVDGGFASNPDLLAVHEDGFEFTIYSFLRLHLFACPLPALVGHGWPLVIATSAIQVWRRDAPHRSHPIFGRTNRRTFEREYHRPAAS